MVVTANNPKPKPLALKCHDLSLTPGTTSTENCAISGGTAPYTDSVITQPPYTSGLKVTAVKVSGMTANFTVTATKTAKSGKTTAKVQVSDSASPVNNAPATLNITVKKTPPPSKKLALSCQPDSATFSKSGSQAVICNVTGGAAGAVYTFKPTTGSSLTNLAVTDAPDGAKDTVTLTVSKLPSTKQSGNVTVKVSDDQGDTPASTPIAVTISPTTPASLTLKCLDLSLTQGTTSTEKCTIIGGTAPYTDSVITQPPSTSGLTVTPGTVSGKTANFKVTAATKATSATATVQVSETESPTIKASTTFNITVSRPTPSGSDDVIAYALLGSPADITTLEKQIKTYKENYPFTQLDISFMSPTMKPSAIKSDIKNNNLGDLLSDAFFAVDGQPPYYTAKKATGEALKALISTLTTNKIKVYFSVGGWAYSVGNLYAPKYVTTFPLTKDIVTDISKYPLMSKGKVTTETIYSKLAANKPPEESHTALDSYTTTDLTDAWVAVARAFGANGIDLDYEEQWLPAQVANLGMTSPFYDPSNWHYPGHPVVKNNFVTIKYAAYLQALENSANSNGSPLGVSIAAPSIGAFNVNEESGFGWKAGNFFWPAGQTAPLKGVIYNMLHPTESDVGLTANASLFKNNKGENILNGLSSLDVMSYDLDDGDTYLGQTSEWCLGFQNGYPVASAPNNGGIDNNSCSIYDQTIAISKAYNKLKPTLTVPINMGMEAYFPNYHITPKGPLGQTGYKTAAQYRWNDPFIVFDIPMHSAILTSPYNASTYLDLPFEFSTNEPCTNPSGCPVPPKPKKNYYLVPSTLATAIKQEGQGMIFWSILSNEQARFQGDAQAAASNKNPEFFTIYSKYVSSFISPLLNTYGEDWKDEIKDIYDAYYGNQATPLAGRTHYYTY